jgi:hypothetical protein
MFNKIMKILKSYIYTHKCQHCFNKKTKEFFSFRFTNTIECSGNFNNYKYDYFTKIKIRVFEGV